MGMGQGFGDWESTVRKDPSAILVFEIIRDYGLETAHERWSWIHPKRLCSLSRKGGKQLERRQGK